MQWLNAQLDEDQRAAEGGVLRAELPPDFAGLTREGMVNLTGPVQARVLREIDSKRQLLAEHKPDASGDCTTCVRPEDFDEDADGNREWTRTAKPYPCPTLRLLAAVYADRPGYLESWRP